MGKKDDRVDQKVLKGFGYVEYMNVSGVKGRRDTESPRLQMAGWSQKSMYYEIIGTESFKSKMLIRRRKRLCE